MYTSDENVERLSYFRLLNALIVLVDDLPFDGKMTRFQANQTIKMLEKFRKDL